MGMTTLQGASLNVLSLGIQENFAPGETVEVLLGLSRDISNEEVGMVREAMKRQGLKSKVEMGSGPWPNTMRLQFQRPVRQQGFAILPLAVLIIGALGAVGIGGVLGWKVGNVVESIGNSIGKSLIPLTLVGGGIWLLSRFVEAKR